MKKKSILIVLAMLFVLIAVTPIRESFAYFTAYDEASGEAAVTLKWETEIVEEIDENQKDKHIVIKNTGDTPVIVRVNVFAGDYAVPSSKDGKWAENTDGWWYYTEILPVGGTTSELYVEVKTEGSPKAPDIDFNIVVVHESSRVVYKNGSTTTLAPPSGWSYVPSVAATEEGGAENA